MPLLDIDSHGIQAVADVGQLLGDLLRHAGDVKPTTTIEPPLERSDFGDLQSRLSEVFPKSNADTAQPTRSHQWAVLETAVRDTFGRLLAESSIDAPDFVRVWNLLDLLCILEDLELCDPALLFWLIEELLDSQTISGCRKIFDYLESRRQKITSKHFASKKLVILRTCNELLRRLSRARDTAFCGRVFIFLFQSFPLGDKSSVNLRGEFHVENVTTYDQDAAKRNGATTDQMEIDGQPATATPNEGKQATLKHTSSDAKGQGPPVDMDALYPIFWSLQSSFSQPKNLFDRKNFAEFQSNLQSTLSALEYAQGQASSRSKQYDGGSRAGQKRKRDPDGNELADSFNPRYLTSRDLFELELSDLTFRRYILVQALIIMEFLLSLSAEAKEKLAQVKVNNKSVTYSDQVLSDEEAKWAVNMKDKISAQLTSISVGDGQYFHRIVATVLARDKNWVRWKIGGCPQIELPSVPPEQFVEAKKTVHRQVNKKHRSNAGSALSLDFLSTSSNSSVLDSLKVSDRYQLPELGMFQRKIAEDDLEIDMPMNDKSKAEAIEGKASKSWRALRIASKSRMAEFDKIEDPDKIDVIFARNEKSQAEPEADNCQPGKQPDDLRPLIISGPRLSGKSSLIKLLQERNPRVFGKVRVHTTRGEDADELKDHERIVVSATEFSTMIDSDRFLEYGEVDGEQFGTSKGAISTIVDAEKVPIMEMSTNGVRQTKEYSFEARHVFVKPPDTEVLSARLKDQGVAAEKVVEILKAVQEDIDRSATAAYDEIIVNDDLEAAYTALEHFVYGTKTSGEDETMGGTKQAQEQE
ncbi:guanylate kinase [Pyricularia oryzae]|uniref:Guanylate kinase n=2 Tax=Pyricularia oryzae TaxID=318829 RepID=A0AA97P9C2_PYRO3|nr:guanylate kinase [Pyricularia oryzae Y34]KAI7924258.1 guanylate kinase [Pyricularia oryzae]